MTPERFEVAENVVTTVGGTELILVGTMEDDTGPGALLAGADPNQRPTEIRIGAVLDLGGDPWRVEDIVRQDVSRPYIVLERLAQ